jgi:amino acid transporter
VAITALLYRDIESTGRLAVAMLGIVLATVGWVIVGGFVNSSMRLAFAFPPNAYALDRDLIVRVGATAVLAMYSYGGYNQVCSIGEEIKDPDTTVPRSILLSIVVVAALYIAMSVAIVGLVPWQEAASSRTIAATFVEHSFGDAATGRAAAWLMTGLILFVAAASLFSVVLGYSRVPFAAARNGDFFPVFARVHPTKRVPHVSLLAIGAASLPFCFFTLGQLVNWLMQVQILTIFVWQCAGVILLRRFRRDVRQPFTMWAYPLPAVIALVMWTYIYATGPSGGVWFSVGFFAGSVALYGIFVKGRRAR